MRSDGVAELVAAKVRALSVRRRWDAKPGRGGLPLALRLGEGVGVTATMWEWNQRVRDRDDGVLHSRYR